MARERTACVCGHLMASHEHYRAGTECVACEPGVCAQFRQPSWWRRLDPVRAISTVVRRSPRRTLRDRLLP